MPHGRIQTELPPHFATRACVEGEQLLDLLTQFSIIATGKFKHSGAMLRVGFRRPVKHFLDLCPAFRSQTTPTRFSSLYEAKLRPASNPGGP